jgi:hypothetical protein
VVVVGIVVVVGGGVTVEQLPGIVVVVVVASAELSCAEVDVVVTATAIMVSNTDRTTQRPNQWCVRVVTQRMYNVATSIPLRCAWFDEWSRDHGKENSLYCSDDIRGGSAWQSARIVDDAGVVSAFA